MIQLLNEDEDIDGIEDDWEEEVERQLETEEDDDHISVESEFHDNEREDAFAIVMGTEEGLVIEMDYSTEINATEQEFNMRIEFVRLIEFVDENNDGVLNDEEDIKSIALHGIPFSSPVLSEITSDDGESGYQIESHLADGDFMFQVLAYMFPTFAVMDGITLSPYELKITIVIEYFPYESENSLLALVIEGFSELEIHNDVEEPEGENNDYQEHEDEIYVESETVGGFFSWINETLADGVIVPINSSITSSEWGSRIVFVYPHADVIVHDPTLGLSVGWLIRGPPVNLLEDSTFLLIGGSAIIALIITAGILRTRPRIQNGH